MAVTSDDIEMALSGGPREAYSCRVCGEDLGWGGYGQGTPSHTLTECMVTLRGKIKEADNG